MISIFRDMFDVNHSFWLGFIAGALFLWILSRIWQYLPQIPKLVKRTYLSLREFFLEGIEQRYRADIIRFSQSQHIASPMSSLDEILIKPQVMVKPVEVAIDNQTLSIDTINLTIPYIPDWPELGALYQTPKISILDTLQKRANIALAGNPGSGKTVALAYIASQVARKSSESGNLANQIPIFIHSVDINYDPNSEQAVDFPAAIAEAISHQISAINLPRLPKFIQSALDTNRALILLDGLDELPPDRIRTISSFLAGLVKRYPQQQIIASVAFENFAGLPSLGFHVLALAAWGDSEKHDFVRKWNDLWIKLTSKSNQGQLQWCDQQYLSSWLGVQNLPSKPLEMTLKVWGAFAGDILGPDECSAIEAYLRRLIPSAGKYRDVLERLAFQMIVSLNPAIQPKMTDTVPLSSFRDGERGSEPYPAGQASPEMQRVKLNQLPPELLGTGMLHMHSGTRLRFTNPVFTGYLAGKALIIYGGLNRVLEQPAWSGKSSTLHYLAHFGDALPAIQYLLKRDDFLRGELLRIARWLTVTPPNQPWRSIILRSLVTAMHAEKQTLPLVARIITSLATSGDPGVYLLFRQLLQSENENLRLLATLACGITRDPKASSELNRLLSDKSPSIVRSASLALVAIGDKQALEIVADALLHGTEVSRRAAAEALANDPRSGYPTLKDGSSHEDLRVRHSIVYGLMRIHQPWAREILTRMQLEEKEWIVRNAAIQAIEELTQPAANIPQPLPDLSETPWLIDYAAKQGMGVSPGRPAHELVVEALKIGTTIEKLQALSYLGMFGDEPSIPVIYSWYFGSSGEIRDAAFQTLWLLANSGVSLPPPRQFGFEQ